MNRRWEYPVAALMVACGALHFVLYAQFMATSSLWVDEMMSIMNYSSRGVIVSWLEYSSNNHSFFNVVQALLPQEHPYSPSSARLLSIVACGMIFPLVIWICWPRGWIVEGGVVLLLFGTNAHLLDWALQARGYGLQLLCGGVVFHGVLLYHENRQRLGLGLAASAVVLGTWAIPTFVLFGGPVLFLIWAIDRTPRAFLFGAATLVLILGYYLPSTARIVAEASSYGEVHGVYFDSVSALTESVRQWILPLPIAAAWCVIAAFIAIPLLPRLPAAVRRSARIIVPSATLFILFCFWIGTPPTRITLFISLPVLLLLLIGAFAPVRHYAKQWVPAVGAALAVLFVVVWPGWQKIISVPNVPFENWLEAGTVLEAAFGDDLSVTASFRGHLLDPYLPAGVRRVDDKDGATADVYLDSSFLLPIEERALHLPQRDFYIVIPQRRGLFICLAADFPTQPTIRNLGVGMAGEGAEALVDGSSLSAWRLRKQQAATLTIVPLNPHRVKALNWVQDSAQEVEVLIVAGGVELPQKRIRRYGTFVSADLRGLETDMIEIVLLALNGDVAISQLWLVEKCSMR